MGPDPAGSGLKEAERAFFPDESTSRSCRCRRTTSRPFAATRAPRGKSPNRGHLSCRLPAKKTIATSHLFYQSEALRASRRAVLVLFVSESFALGPSPSRSEESPRGQRRSLATRERERCEGSGVRSSPFGRAGHRWREPDPEQAPATC